MPIIYLVRHTTPNVPKGMCYGRLDVALAPSFTAEASLIAVVLREAKITAFYTSPAQRCGQLAQFLADGSPVHVDARLQEIDFGDWEGKNFNDIPRAEIDAWAADIERYTFPNRESPALCRIRAQSFYEDLMAPATQNCAVIAHGGSIKALLSIVANKPLGAVAAWEISFGAVVAIKI